MKNFYLNNTTHKKDQSNNNQSIYYIKNDSKNIHTEYPHLHNTSNLNADKESINFTKYSANIISYIKEIKKYIITPKSHLFSHKNTLLSHNNTIQKIFLLKNLNKDKYFNDTVYKSLNKNVIKWKKAINQQILFFTCRKENIAEIKLEPKYLGPIDIQIKIKNNTATVNFLSNCRKIKNILNHAIPILKSSLKKHDIKIDNIHVRSTIIENSKIWKKHYNNDENNGKNILNTKNTQKMLNLYQRNMKYFGNKKIDIYV